MKHLGNKYLIPAWICIGWITGLWLQDFAVWEYDNKIGTLDIVTLVATVCSALYIAKVIEQNKDVKQRTKDLLINHANEIDHLLNHIKDLCLNQKDIPYLFLTYDTSQISKEYQKLKTDLKEKGEINITDKQNNTLKTELLTLRKFCTESTGSLLARNDSPVKISNGFVSFSPQRCSDILNSLAKISSELRNIKYSIVSA